jgi:hypothetical protein
MKEREQVGDLGVDESMILNWILKIQDAVLD